MCAVKMIFLLKSIQLSVCSPKLIIMVMIQAVYPYVLSTVFHPICNYVLKITSVNERKARGTVKKIKSNPPLLFYGNKLSNN